MTKKELQILKRQYKEIVFDHYYYRYLAKIAKTQDAMEAYHKNINNEVMIEILLRSLNLDPEILLNAEERRNLRELARESVKC